MDDELDRLYGLPRDEFTKARDDAVRQVRRAGDRDGAKLLAAARKPTAAAWAVNQLARRDPEGVKALLGAGERLRAAGIDRERLRAATQEERAAVNRLADVAAGFAGRPTDTVREAIRQTLHAAALDADVREGIAEGRVIKEARAIGLGSPPLEAGPSAASPPTRRSSPEARGSEAPKAPKGPGARAQGPGPPRTALREAERRLTAARRRLTRSAAELEGAEERVDEAGRELRRRQDALDRAREQEHEAQAELRRAVEWAAAAGMRRGDLAKAAGLSAARLRGQLGPTGSS